jgi:hypothetical protein
MDLRAVADGRGWWAWGGRQLNWTVLLPPWWRPQPKEEGLQVCSHLAAPPRKNRANGKQ